MKDNNTNGAFHTFEQLLEKETLFNGPWGLYGLLAALVIT